MSRAKLRKQRRPVLPPDEPDGQWSPEAAAMVDRALEDIRSANTTRVVTAKHRLICGARRNAKRRGGAS